MSFFTFRENLNIDFVSTDSIQLKSVCIVIQYNQCSKEQQPLVSEQLLLLLAALGMFPDKGSLRKQQTFRDATIGFPAK